MRNLKVRVERLERKRSKRDPALLKAWVEHLRSIAEIEASSRGETWGEEHERRLVAQAEVNAERDEQILDFGTIVQRAMEEMKREQEEKESAQAEKNS